jgi:hypothetical protein
MKTVPTSEARSDAAGWCSLRDRGGLAIAAAWIVLVAIAVVGRIWRPEWNGSPLWNVTPLAAVALAAGALFPSRVVAASVPLAALALGNLVEPEYGSLAIAVVVYAASAWPVLLGGLVNRFRWAAVVGGAAASSLVFFLTTNLAHWFFVGGYPRSAVGIVECMVAALPFYRPLGDVCWSLVLFAGIVAAGVAEEMLARRLQPAPASRQGR